MDVKPRLPDELLRAAAIESVTKSVSLELEADLFESNLVGLSHPSEACLRVARNLAMVMAIKFCRQTWIDIAGFLSDDNRVAVLAHSMETGRRVTLYVGENALDAIQTSVSGEPICSTVTTDAVPSLLAWVSQID